MSAEPAPQSEPNIPPSRLQFSQTEPDAKEHELVLTKNGQRYVFRCVHGKEHDLLKQLASEVESPGSDLTWFDAAVLSHQMGQMIKQRLTSKI